MAALGMPLVPPVPKMSAPSPCPASASTALICRKPAVSRTQGQLYMILVGVVLVDDEFAVVTGGVQMI